MTKTFSILLGLTLLLSFGVVACGQGQASNAPSPDCMRHTLPESGHRGEQFAQQPKMVIARDGHYTACLQTTKGNIIIALTSQRAPLAVNNFVFLALHKFYTHILFHRVIKGFMIQTGDPTGTGSGGPGYSFPIEKSGGVYPTGTVAMANTGQPNSNGSQFFVCEGSQCAGLNDSQATGPGYTIFGHVLKGMDVVKAIAQVPTKMGADGQLSSPKTPVYLNGVTIAGPKLSSKAG